MSELFYQCINSERVMKVSEKYTDEMRCLSDTRRITLPGTPIPSFVVIDVRTENGVKIINSRVGDDEIQLRLFGRRLSVCDGDNLVIIHLSMFHANRFIQAIGWE